MDFTDTPAESEFRKEATAWLERTLPCLPDGTALRQADREQRARVWQELLYEGGWAGLSWPVEYGGRGLSVVHEAIFNAEAGSRGAPRPINFLAMILAGPTILVHGTEEQKQRFLPPILSGEEIWCQGFSEPDAGSDLASLTTRASRVEGGWLVNGHKVWTSFAHLASRCMLLARTDAEASPHRGLTYLCAPMERVEVTAITMVNGDTDFNAVRWDGVDVADADVLGEVGNGWTVAMSTLGFERGALSLLFYVEARHTLDALVDLVRGRGEAGTPAAIATALGGFHADVEALRVLVIRQLSGITAGRPPGPEGSIPKLVWSQLMQDMTRCALLLDTASDEWTHRYLRARGNSVEGGTSEILRSIVAERVLGLPRSR